MLSPQEIESQLESILLKVQKPGRYVGGEFNQIIKPWENIGTRVALAFPEIYDIGLPNLGLAILYESINRYPDALAERVYSPWVDMEEVMRAYGIPLYSLETKHPIAEFDILGFSLPYETLYTNALNLLDLAGIPIFSSERTEAHPLIIAGGHSTFNPEPMSPFIDAFVIGEGEEVIHEILQLHRAWKTACQPRLNLLKNLANLKGVYVPSLYHVEYQVDNTVAAISPIDLTLPTHIQKRMVARLPPPPVHFIVPNIDVIHNRVSVEIMRGCTRGCRFCHAGMINRPVRERPVKEILDAITQALEQTGFEEVSLLSLSSSDYTNILELVDAVSQRFAGKHLSISLPSLRIESASVDLFEKLKGVRQGSFTLAPEAASERMRTIINKPIPDAQLLETARAIYSRGWNTIKLYFMIGHPEETLEDVQAIANLCKKVLAEGRRIIGKRANLHAGVSTFVPKPHTPFQWVPCESLDQIETKQKLLQESLRGPGLKLNWTDPKATMLEAWLSRGDRKLSKVIFTAWKNGAKFDAWQDHFHFETWLDAFRAHGLDPEFYTHRRRFLDEVFPWEHIDAGVTRKFLTQDYTWSLQGKTRPDCRTQCYACGILPGFNEARRQTPGDHWKCPEVLRERVRKVAVEHG